MPNDHPEDLEFGAFWSRHRELDNILSSAFMFLPERFRLPGNKGNPVAAQINLNLHAAVICLHLAARDKADKFKLGSIGQASRTRTLTAAREIVDIIKLTKAATAPPYRGPLMALSLFLAASVFISQAKEDPDSFDKANLEFLIDNMNAIRREHFITKAYLNQLARDIELSGISVSIGNPASLALAGQIDAHHNIPLVARGATTEPPKMRHPLHSRLDIAARRDALKCHDGSSCGPWSTFLGPFPRWEEPRGSAEGPATKRMRTSDRLSSGVPTGQGTHASAAGPSAWSAGREGRPSVVALTPKDVFGYSATHTTSTSTSTTSSTSWSYATKHRISTTLPHRTGSPAMNNSQAMSSAPPPPAAGAVPTFASFPMPGAAAAAPPPPYPPMPGAAPFGTSNLDTTTTATTTTTTTTASTATASSSSDPTSLNPADLGSLDGAVFDSLVGDWGLTDPESVYAMLLDVSGDTFGAAQDHVGGGGGGDGLDVWAAALSSAGSLPGGGGGSNSGGGGGSTSAGGGGGRGAGAGEGRRGGWDGSGL
jgi:hypothetical protein